MVLTDEQKFPSACRGHLISMNILAGQGILHLRLTIRRDIGPTYRHKIPNTLKEEAPPKLPDIHAFRFMIMFAYCCTIGL
jgi:hypothetical protein